VTGRQLSRVLVLPALALALALAGCGGSDDDGAETTTAAATTTTVATTTQAATTTRPATTTTATTTRAVTTTAKPQATTIRIAVVDAKPQGGIARPSVKRGERVVLVVTSDTADEIHLHGYDLSADVEAGGTVRIPFVADTRGRFEVELENLGVQLAEITVS
jgi:hypothetical protein